MKHATTFEDLSILLFNEEGTYVAQCLEHDIGAQGKTFKQVIFRIMALISAESKKSPTFAGIERAPQCYWDMAESAMEIVLPRGPSSERASASGHLPAPRQSLIEAICRAGVPEHVHFRFV